MNDSVNDSMRVHGGLLLSRVPARRTCGSRDLGSKGARDQGSEGSTPQDFSPARPLGPYRTSGDPAAPFGPCRFCGEPSWIADPAGPVHRCCARAEAAGDLDCLPCRTSWAAARRWQRRLDAQAGDRDDQAGGRR